jgi:hypothetical protein
VPENPLRDLKVFRRVDVQENDRGPVDKKCLVPVTLQRVPSIGAGVLKHESRSLPGEPDTETVPGSATSGRDWRINALLP